MCASCRKTGRGKRQSRLGRRTLHSTLLELQNLGPLPFLHQHEGTRAHWPPRLHWAGELLLSLHSPGWVRGMGAAGSRREGMVPCLHDGGKSPLLCCDLLCALGQGAFPLWAPRKRLDYIRGSELEVLRWVLGRVHELPDIVCLCDYTSFQSGRSQRGPCCQPWDKSLWGFHILKICTSTHLR